MMRLSVIRWVARILGLCVLLLWGTFFIEHLLEWFFVPLSKMPPCHVWVGQLIHLIMLAGFIIAWKWEFIGGITIIVSSFVFFIDKAASRFPLFFGVTIIPAVMFLYCWWRTKKLLAT